MVFIRKNVDMKIAFRTDASIQIGTGHVMRCLTLAEELRNRRVEIQFICRAHQGHMADLIAAEGFQVHLLPAQEHAAEITDGHKEDYAIWLGATQEEDVQQTKNALGSCYPDWFIVDHYGLDIQWENALQPYVTKIMVIDDLANRKHNCDLLFDQNFSLDFDNRYSGLLPEQCDKLIGPRYALLRPEYIQFRRTMNDRGGEIKRVLVFLGGSDNVNLTGMTLDALSVPELAHLEVDVIVGTNNPYRGEIAMKVKLRPNSHLHGPRPHLADLMSKADLAIGGGGGTTWERMCLGLPSIVICLAENQKPACEAISREGLVQYVGTWKQLTKTALAENIIALCESQELMDFQSKICQSTVDGWGAKRIAEFLRPSSKKDLYLRPARTDDALLYYGWVNDSAVRQNAFNSELLFLNNYLEWFEKRNADTDTYMFVLMARDLPVGQIKFELQNNEAVIDYSLDRIVRGRGWGRELVRIGTNMLNNIRPAVIPGCFKRENYEFLAAFMRLGFDDKALQGAAQLSIAILSDKKSWINTHLPRLVQSWLNKGHKVLWVHEKESLLQADFCFYLSYGQIVPFRILNMFKHNLVVHESDLPRGKGWSPLTWQILEGKKQVPVTMIEADEKVDSGPVYAQEWINLQGDELVEEIRAEQAEATIRLCEKFVTEYPQILNTAKDQTGEGSFYPRRKPENSRLDPDKSLREQFNLLRVVDNNRYPAFFNLHGLKYTLTVEKTEN